LPNAWYPPGLTVPRAIVLEALTTASDHIPVVADYQVPAKMAAALVGTVPARVIVGAPVSISVSVGNVAPVSAAIGGDALDYTYAATGNLTGGGTARAVALAPAPNVHAFAVDTSTPGAKTGAVRVTGTSQAVSNGSFTQNVSTSVLAHANASFSSVAAVTSLTVDLGIVAQGSAPLSRPLALHNPPAATPVAALDLDQVAATGDTARLSVDLSPFTNLAAGGSRPFATTLLTDRLGAHATTYQLAVSDEDLPGATSSGMTLTLIARVALGGDANLDSEVDFNDLVPLSQHYNLPLNDGDGWGQGDFNGDRRVDFDDLVVLAQHYNSPEAGGPSFTSAFAADTGRAFATVPEPRGVTLLAAAAFAALSRFQRRRASSTYATPRCTRAR
jgi:hypothetical protein